MFHAEDRPLALKEICIQVHRQHTVECMNSSVVHIHPELQTITPVTKNNKVYQLLISICNQADKCFSQ